MIALTGSKPADPVHERAQQARGLAANGGHEPGGDLHPGVGGHQLRGAGDRQVVGADRQRGPGVHSRPVLGPAGHPRRGQPGRDLPAGRAFPRLHPVLDHPRRRGRGGLEHLAFLHAGPPAR